jgi:carbonic anhydrase
MHIVHELIDGPDHEYYNETLAVIGIIFKLADESHPFVRKLRTEDLGNIENIHFDELFHTLDGEKRNKKSNQIDFYHYKGSLTTPPCTDVVNWILYKEVLPISAKHLKQLSSCWHDHLHGHDNFRKVQPLYGRRVVRNFIQ